MSFPNVKLVILFFLIKLKLLFWHKAVSIRSRMTQLTSIPISMCQLTFSASGEDKMAKDVSTVTQIQQRLLRALASARAEGASCTCRCRMKTEHCKPQEPKHPRYKGGEVNLEQVRRVFLEGTLGK